MKFSNRITAYSIGPIELKLRMIILDINLHNPHEENFLVAGGGTQNSKVFADVICTCSLVSQFVTTDGM